MVSYHEIGHALVAAMQSHSAPVQKITIIPRTSGALGYTMQVEQGDKYLMTKQEIENKIAQKKLFLERSQQVLPMILSRQRSWQEP